MAATPQRCRVPGCGPLSEAESRFAWVARICDFHQAADAVELNGELWRLCRPCIEMHSLDWFEGSEHVCRRYTNRRGDCELMAHHVDSRGQHVANRHRRGRAAAGGAGLTVKMEPPWGQGLVDYMAGRTLASKLSIPALYSAAVWRMGFQQPLTWAVLGSTAVGLHALLPHLHMKHYLKPLRALRKLAAKRRMSVSPALELVTSNSKHLLLFEKMAAECSSCGWLCDTLLFAALLAVCGSRICIVLMAQYGCGVWSATPLVVSLLVVAPLRARAILNGQHYRRQWIDFAADLFCRAGQFGSDLLDSTTSPQAFVRVSAIEFHGICMALEAMTMLARMLVLQKPLRWSIASEAAVAVFVVCTAPLIAQKVGDATGLPASAYGLLPCSAAANLLLSGMLYVARRAQSEGRYLQAFLTRDPEKYDGRVLRPRLGLSAKLRGATPDDLPWDLREHMLRLPEEEVESLEGFIRPGCVLLTLSYRFGSSESLETARAAVLANLRRVSAASNLPWATMDAVVTVADTRFTVEGGEVVKEEAVLSPVIISVDRVALFDAKTATLQAMGLGSEPFSVMLRTGKDYLELEAVSEDTIGSDIKLLTVSLPEFPDPGMAWLEVHSHDAGGGCPIISDGFPVMFTWKERLAEELNGCLLDRLPTVQHVASFLEDVATHLSEGVLCRNPDSGPAVASLLLQEVMRLGLPECFSLLVHRADTLEAADSVPPGLLAAAIRSGSEELLGTVIDLLEWHSLPVDPCRVPPGSLAGHSPLHLAAQQGNAPMVALLLDKVPEPELQWLTLKSAVGSRTPDELMKAHHPRFSVKAVVRTLASSQAKAVWGIELAAALCLQTTASRIGFAAAYLVVMWVVGCREPLALLALALVASGLHLLGPRLHKVYVQRLQQVREAAESCKLSVSPGLRILEAEAQHAYEQSELHRSPRQPLVDSLLLTAMELPAALFPCWESWKHSGRDSPELWTVAQAVVVLGVLTALRTWAVKAGRLAGRQWVDIMAWNYCIMSFFGHRVYLWAVGSKGCILPTQFVEALADPIMTSKFPVLGVAISFAMKVLLVSGPVSREAFVMEPLFGMVTVYSVGSTVSSWCLKAINGADMPACFGHTVAALWFVGSVFYVGLRVQSEADRLCHFLAGMRRSMGTAKAG